MSYPKQVLQLPELQGLQLKRKRHPQLLAASCTFPCFPCVSFGGLPQIFSYRFAWFTHSGPGPLHRALPMQEPHERHHPSKMRHGVSKGMPPGLVNDEGLFDFKQRPQ